MSDSQEPAALQGVPSSDGADAYLDPQTAFAELGRIFLGSQPLGEVLETVADLARRTIHGADQVSVTLLDQDGANARSVAFTGDLAIDLDERQYERGFGPCLDAAQLGATLHIADTATEQTYPEFAAACQRSGVSSTLSVGLPVPQRSIGAINIYLKNNVELDERDIEIAQTFASYAAVALANAALYTSTADLAAQMEKAMQSRAAIEQAKGIIMGAEGCTGEEAFTILAKQSQRRNRKLKVVAEELIADAQAGEPPDLHSV
jgi:GAF domain-containing protein